jgi:uncharacterized membrane protein YeaQ/YmgE (transglycosylase-associated protein family)
MGATVIEPKEPKRSDIATFALAMLGVPAIAFFVLLLEIRGESGTRLLTAALSAAIGACVGISIVFAVRKRQLDATPRANYAALMLIIAGAIIGASSDVMPTYVETFIDGLVVGFFTGFAALLVRHWNRDEGFRARIIRGLRS